LNRSMDVGLEGVLLTTYIYPFTRSMVPYSGDGESCPVLVRHRAHSNHRVTQMTAASSTTSSSSSTVANTPIGSVRRGAECVHSTPARTG
jgi:hypothetical protein